MKDKLTGEVKTLQSQLALLQVKTEKFKKDKEKGEDKSEKHQPQFVDNKEYEPFQKQRKGRYLSRGSDGFLMDVIATPPIRRATRQKSSSQEMLDSLGLDSITSHSEAHRKERYLGEPYRASARTVVNGSSDNKLSITKLVAESIRNPESVASIRRELKADGLTPRIQKKFQRNPISSMPTKTDA